MFDSPLDIEQVFGDTRAMRRTRVRWGRLLGVAVTVAGVVAGARGAAGAPSVPSAPVVRTVHVVRAGETVWGIATSLAGPGGDPRPVVDRIVAMNHLGATPLQAGARLLLPAS